MLIRPGDHARDAIYGSVAGGIGRMRHDEEAFIHRHDLPARMMPRNQQPSRRLGKKP